jgi:hypothetical protein
VELLGAVEAGVGGCAGGTGSAFIENFTTGVSSTVSAAVVRISTGCRNRPDA